MIDFAYARTKDLLLQHKEQLSQPGRLLEREVIFKEDLEQIFGKRKWEDKPEIPLLSASTPNGSSNGKEEKPAALPPVNPPAAVDENKEPS